MATSYLDLMALILVTDSAAAFLPAHLCPTGIGGSTSPDQLPRAIQLRPLSLSLPLSLFTLLLCLSAARLSQDAHHHKGAEFYAI